MLNTINFRIKFISLIHQITINYVEYLSTFFCNITLMIIYGFIGEEVNWFCFDNQNVDNIY